MPSGVRAAHALKVAERAQNREYLGARVVSWRTQMESPISEGAGANLQDYPDLT